MTIYSDASSTGWGASCHRQIAYGHWNSREKSYHINYLELLASFNSLKTFASDQHNCEILLRIDNSTTIAYINKMGGTKYKYLNDLACDIRSWCELKNIWIFASYIPSQDNIDADKAPRIENIDTEWELSSYAFEKITRELGRPNIDLLSWSISNMYWCVYY